MATVGSFSGLASGIQWRDLIDQVMVQDSARRLDPLTAQVRDQRARATSWATYRGTVAKLDVAAKSLRDGAAFGSYTASASTASGGRALLTATAGAGASPGSHTVQVLDLARAEKLSGAVVESTTAALGFEGEFAINGQRVAIAAGDTLASVRDRINAANTGTSPSRVSASILSTGPNAHRLVLTSSVPGAAGIDLVDGASKPLAALGVVSDTESANRTVSGGTATRQVSSVTTAIAAALGVTMPSPSTIRIGDRTVTVDLTVDSLSSIAAKIDAAGVPNRIVESTVDGKASYRLEVEATVGTVAGEEADGARTLSLLGLTRAGREAVAQTVTGDSAWTNAGATATAATGLVGLDVAGLETELADGDVIAIRGTDGAGGAVNRDFVVGASGTVNDLLAAVQDAYVGRGVTASIVEGKLRVQDATGGDSKLAVSLQVSRSGTDLGNLGRVDTTTVGRQRAVVTGSDAALVVDGVRLTRAGNTVTDAIAGVTLNLQAAEPGSTISVAVARDDDATVAAVQKFASAYNEVAAFVKEQTAAGAPLAANGTLRSTMAQLTNAMLTDVVGTPTGSAYARGALVGLALSRTGVLEVDATALRAALGTNQADVKALFGTAGSTSSPALSYAANTSRTQPGAYDVQVTQAATQPVRAGSGFSGTYTATGASDALTITDGVSGKSVTLALTSGMTTADLVTALNARFASDGLRLDASADGTNLRLAGRDYGSSATITAAYQPTTAGAADPFGIAGTAAGLDVAGTIGGAAATGRGQRLTADAAVAGAAANAAEGLSVLFTGAVPGAAGTVSFSRGVAGLMTRVTDLITRPGDGTVAQQTSSIDQSIATLGTRVTAAESRLEQRRESLTAQFSAMEAALSRLQSQGNWLTQQISALQGSRD